MIVGHNLAVMEVNDENEKWTRRDLNPSNREGSALAPDTTCSHEKTILEKEMDSTGFEPVAFTLQT
jgi:hypothetical protein